MSSADDLDEDWFLAREVDVGVEFLQSVKCVVQVLFRLESVAHTVRLTKFSFSLPCDGKSRTRKTVGVDVLVFPRTTDLLYEPVNRSLG